jgi:hypothetical protein
VEERLAHIVPPCAPVVAACGNRKAGQPSLLQHMRCSSAPASATVTAGTATSAAPAVAY